MQSKYVLIIAAIIVLLGIAIYVVRLPHNSKSNPETFEVSGDYKTTTTQGSTNTVKKDWDSSRYRELIKKRDKGELTDEENYELTKITNRNISLMGFQLDGTPPEHRYAIQTNGASLHLDTPSSSKNGIPLKAEPNDLFTEINKENVSAFLTITDK